jgi:hypothetical protein
MTKQISLKKTDEFGWRKIERDPKQRLAELLIESPLTEDVLVVGKESILFLERKNAIDPLFSICVRGKRPLAEDAIFALERIANRMRSSSEVIQYKALGALRSAMSAAPRAVGAKATAAVVRFMSNNRLDSAAEEIRKAVAELK